MLFGEGLSARAHHRQGQQGLTGGADLDLVEGVPDLSWVTPEEAASISMRAEMPGSHGVLVRQALALAHVGYPI